MTRLTRSSKNTINPSFLSRRSQRPKDPARNIIPAFLAPLLAVALAACGPTYPSATLTAQITKLAREEEATDVASRIVGKTLWVYIPMGDLVDEAKVTWNSSGLEKMSKILGLAHRVVLSTDAKIDFLTVVASDVKKFGVELMSLEYVPDIREAMLEKFSRGEFFMRSVRDVSFNPAATQGGVEIAVSKFYDISFNRFLAMQIIHRTKNLFAKDKTLMRFFELKSTASSEKFGIIKIEMEFLPRRYDIKTQEEIKPLEYVRMIAALVVANYNRRDFQAVELSDTFSGKTLKLSPEDLKKTKIRLPEFTE